MSVDADLPAGLRRAALTLHSLGGEDREWMLQQLAPTQRATLSALLAELRELNLPQDAEVIRGALSQASVGETLPRDEALALCLALEREAPVVQSLLLAALAAPAREAVLGHWQTEFHARPSPASAPNWTPALREAVLASWREVADGVKP